MKKANRNYTLHWKENQQIHKMPKQYNINTRIKNYLPLLTQINNNKRKTINENNLNGIYKLNSQQCNTTYIGEIDGKFLTRLKEYKA